MTDKQFDKDDIFLLMESYKNMIDLNRTVLEQQKVQIEKTNDLIDVQKNVCNGIKELLTKFENIEENISEAKNNISEHKQNSNKDHSTLLSKINILYIGMSVVMITIIAGVSGLFIKTFELIKSLHP